MRNQIKVDIFLSTVFILIYNVHIICGKRLSDMTLQEMIELQNYTSESHLVTTEDGYILTLYRIPGSPGSIPVFLQHGLFQSAADFLYLGKNKSLGYILSDNGYDVWFGNTRGNTESKMHVNLSTSDPQFWDFSIDEMGLYDTPASLEYILKITNNTIFMVNYSMGGPVSFMMASQRPEIAKSVRAIFAMAPSVYTEYSRQPLLHIGAFFLNELQIAANLLGIHELLGRGLILNFTADYVCSLPLLDTVCKYLILAVAGAVSNQLDAKLLSRFLSKTPAGISIKSFVHWLQQVESQRFCKYDYGLEKNLELYNSSEPPSYDIAKIEIPTALFWAENDWIVDEKDAKRTYDDLQSPLGMFRVNHTFDHIDFIWGTNASELVYSKIISLMSKLS